MNLGYQTSELLWLLSASLLQWSEFRGICAQDSGLCGASPTHAPAHGATGISAIVLGAGSHLLGWKGEPTWHSLPSRDSSPLNLAPAPLPPAAQHGVSEKSLRGHPGLSLPHLRVLVPCCNFMGREEAGLTPWSTVSANSCRGASSPDSKM